MILNVLKSILSNIYKLSFGHRQVMPTPTCIADWISVSPERCEELLLTFSDLPVLVGYLTQDGKSEFKTKMKNVKIHFYYSESSDTYLAMVHFLNDGFAMKLAEKGVSRGFPLIKTKNGWRSYGFHPKFKNDQRQVNDLTEFKGTKRLQVMLKFSGFLGQVITWSVEDTIYWTTLSKNGATNEYAEDVRRIVAKFMTPKLVSTLETRGLYFCGEVISQKDATHGAVPRTEEFVTTCVGWVQRTEDSKRYSSILDHDTMHQVCMELGIPVAEIWTFDKPMEIAGHLSKRRDFVNMSELRILLNKYATQTLTGSLKHEDILGNCIEGLVMWKIAGSDKIAVKYKFPIYTTRTFAIRPSLNSDPTTMLSPEFLSHVRWYLDFWVITPEGRRHWMNWLCCAALTFEGFVPEVGDVGLHLQLSEKVNEVFDSRIDYVKQFMPKISTSKMNGEHTVIVVLGPIGSGKSTTGQGLEEQIPGSQHIDGDTVVSSGHTQKLGPERNLTTLTMVLLAILAGKIPILSSGGGVLFEGRKNPQYHLANYLEKTLGVRINLVIYIPCEVTELETFYKSWNVSSVIKYRIEAELWEVPNGKKPEQFIKDIQKRSENNWKFPQMLVGHAGEVLTFQPVVPGIAKTSTTLPKALKLSEEIEIINYNQLRLLVGFFIGNNWKMAHITLDYSGGKPNSIRVSDYQVLRSFITGKKLPATHVIFQGETKKDGCSFLALKPCVELSQMLLLLVDPLRNNPHELHVTVNTGKHQASTMGKACLQWHEHPDEVSIPNTSEEQITYNKIKTSDTEIELFNVIMC